MYKQRLKANHQQHLDFKNVKIHKMNTSESKPEHSQKRRKQNTKQIQCDVRLKVV